MSDRGHLLNNFFEHLKAYLAIQLVLYRRSGCSIEISMVSWYAGVNIHGFVFFSGSARKSPRRDSRYPARGNQGPVILKKPSCFYGKGTKISHVFVFVFVKKWSSTKFFWRWTQVNSEGNLSTKSLNPFSGSMSWVLPKFTTTTLLEFVPLSTLLTLISQL